MNKISLVMLLASMLFSTSLVAEELEYKCYLQTSAGPQISLHFWPAQQTLAKQAKLVDQMVDVKDMEQQVRVIKVIECAPLYNEFKIREAYNFDDMQY